MRPADALGVHVLAERTFADLSARMHEPPAPARPPESALVRFRHLLDRDRGGCWVAEAEGAVVGAAVAIERDGLWGLSLLVADPRHQSAGMGRALLARALEHGDGGRRGAVILASSDPRALRVYARAGFTPHPCLSAHGRPAGTTLPPTVREGGAADLALAERVDRAVRGARAPGCSWSTIAATRPSGRTAASRSLRRWTTRRPPTCCARRSRPFRPG